MYNRKNELKEQLRDLENKRDSNLTSTSSLKSDLDELSLNIYSDHEEKKN